MNINYNFINLCEIPDSAWAVWRWRSIFVSWRPSIAQRLHFPQTSVALHVQWAITFKRNAINTAINCNYMYKLFWHQLELTADRRISEKGLPPEESQLCWRVTQHLHRSWALAKHSPTRCSIYHWLAISTILLQFWFFCSFVDLFVYLPQLTSGYYTVQSPWMLAEPKFQVLFLLIPVRNKSCHSKDDQKQSS